MEIRVTTLENKVSALEGRFVSMEATLEEIRAERNINRDCGRRRNQRRSSEESRDSVNVERRPPEKGDVQRSGMKRVELPTLGVDPMGWIAKAEKFFDLQNVTERKKMKLKTRHPNWKMFTEALTRRFGGLDRGTVLEKLATVQQKGSVDELNQEFEILVAQASGVGERMAKVRQEGYVNADGGQKDEEDEKINNLLDMENMGKGMGETELKLSTHQPPLLFRYRLFHMDRTIKGTLLVKRKLLPRIIHVRHSMIKALLESNLEDANHVFSNKRVALRASLNNGIIDEYIVAKMILYGIPLDEPFLQHHPSILAREEHKKLRGGKLYMPECFYLMGTVDPTRCLEKDQDCIIHENGQITGDVLVYRNPGLHFSDIHIMCATYVDNLESFVGHSKYANFFPCVWTRSVADEIAGGDYKAIVQSLNPLIPPIFSFYESVCCSEWNAAMERLTGEIFGSFCRLKGQYTLANFMILIYRGISGQDSEKLPFGFFDRNGEIVESYITANKRIDAGGNIHGCFCFLQVVTPDLNQSSEEHKLIGRENIFESKELAYILQVIETMTLAWRLSQAKFVEGEIEESDLTPNKKGLVEGRELLGALKDIKDHLLQAYSFEKEVTRMWEVNIIKEEWKTLEEDLPPPKPPDQNLEGTIWKEEHYLK
ncbi:hypothetical protein V8G54_009918 [Vigna mungo]|uniref:RNA-dependent RNA polymerase n=1 Tax=Vigna mungo TaxID=3915 RepID=A0AAQ3S5X7_VIGMU